MTPEEEEEEEAQVSVHENKKQANRRVNGGLK